MRRVTIVIFALTLTAACNDAPLPTAATTTTAHAAGNVANPRQLSGLRSAVVRRDLGTLGGKSSFAADINGSGTVVGWSDMPDGGTNGFRWTVSGGMTALRPLPGYAWSRALSIKDNGRILGLSGMAGQSGGVAVEWHPSGQVDSLSIPLLPGAQYGAPSDFDGNGNVVGWDVFVSLHAWAWSASGGKVDITREAPGGAYEGESSQVNSAGTVVGSSGTFTCVRQPDCWRPFLWDAEGGYRDLGLPDADPTTVATGLGVNERETVVGWTSGSGRMPTPYRWNAGTGFELLPSSGNGYAMSVNSLGLTVGANFDTTFAVYQAMAWTRNGDAVILDPGNRFTQIAVSVNALGMVAGWSGQDAQAATVHATVWIVDPSVGRVAHLPNIATVQTATYATVRAATPPPMSVAAIAAAGCASDMRALVSRRALFDCVARR